MKRRTFVLAGVALSTGLASCSEETVPEHPKEIPMASETEELVAAVFAATSAEDERSAAIALGEHLQASSSWSLMLREPNSTSLLTPQQYLQSESAVALISTTETCYVWAPKHKPNIDMLMLE